MSLILDALKRAERERRAGQAPQPLDPVAAPPMDTPATADRRGWRVAGLIVLVLLAVAAAAWALLHRTGSDAGTAPAPASAPAATNTPAPTVAVTSSSSTATLDPPPVASAAKANTATVADDGANTLDDLVDGRSGEKPSAAPDSTRPAANPAASAPTSAQSTKSTALDELPPFEQPVGPPSAQATAAAPAEPITAPSPRPATPAAAASTAQPAEATAPAVRSFRDMSPNYRTDFPALSVDVHVYNDDPQRRFVILNGRRYHEGDTLTEGPRIVAITDDGIIFDYRSERVLYPLPR